MLTFDFSIIWRYFAWTNQTLATIVLWTITAFLIRENKFFWISLLPAVFMTAVVVTYILTAPEGLGIDKNLANAAGVSAAVLSMLAALMFIRRQKQLSLAMQPVAVNQMIGGE